MLIIVPFIIVFCLLIVMRRIRKYNKNNSDSINKFTHIKAPLDSYEISNSNNSFENNSYDSSEKVIDKLPDEIKECVLKGNVKITDNLNKKITKYHNGEKVSEEEINSNNIIEKKSIQKCPNCGASIDLSSNECIYCRTKIN